LQCLVLKLSSLAYIVYRNHCLPPWLAQSCIGDAFGSVSDRGVLCAERTVLSQERRVAFVFLASDQGTNKVCKGEVLRMLNYHATKTQGSRGEAPSTVYLGTRWGWVINVMRLSLNPGRRWLSPTTTPVPCGPAPSHFTELSVSLMCKRICTAHVLMYEGTVADISMPL
jgi:hypothetical protein